MSQTSDLFTHNTTANEAIAAIGFGARLAYGIEDFANAAGIGRTTVYEEIASCRLKARKVGKRTLILAEDARTFLSRLPEMQAA